MVLVFGVDVRFATIPLKALSGLGRVNYPQFLENLYCSFSTKVTCKFFATKTMQQIVGITHFPIWKNYKIFHNIYCESFEYSNTGSFEITTTVHIKRDCFSFQKIEDFCVLSKDTYRRLEALTPILSNAGLSLKGY